MRTVEFYPKAVGYLLIGVVSLLVAFNIYGVFVVGLMSVPSLLITSVVLYMLCTRHRWTKPIVRLWAALIMITGGLGVFIFLIAVPEGGSPVEVGVVLFQIAFGGIVYGLDRWCILSPERAELREKGTRP